jgi:hypothetical protein
MAKKPELTPFEKAALKHVKYIYKTGNPGDLQRTIDAMGPVSKATVASAIKKTKPASRAAKVNKPTKQAKPDEIKVRGKTTGKLSTLNTKPKPRGGRGVGGAMLGGGGSRGPVIK